MAWMQVAVTHRVFDLLRAEKRRRQVPLAVDLATSSEPSHEGFRAEIVVTVRTRLRAMEANGAKSAAQLLEWRFLEGKTVKEIAVILGIEPRKVTYRLRHAKDAFKASLRLMQRGAS